MVREASGLFNMPGSVGRSVRVLRNNFEYRQEQCIKVTLHTCAACLRCMPILLKDLRSGPRKKRNLKQKKLKYVCPGSVWPNCSPRVILCLRRCPWNFECTIVYAWYECHYLIGTGTEAELLVELLTSRAVLLQCSPEPLNDV